MKNITNQLITWYETNKRDLPWRHTKNPYYIWISEIMLQQTRVEAVKEYYIRFIKKLPTIQDLAFCNEDDLLKLWEGLGYYSRVRNMQKTAKLLVEQKKKTLPNTKEELLKLPGIGAYTAGAILSIAYDKPTITIDGNVYRILGRYYMISTDIKCNSAYTVYSSYLEKILPIDKASSFVQSFMDLGSLVCTPKNPQCNRCPLQDQCLAYKEKQTEKYPIKTKKKEQRIEERCVYLFTYQQKVAIQKRKENGLLALLYEFPNEKETLSVIDVENKLNSQGIPYRYVEEIGEAKHVFSHIIWYMKGFHVEANEELDGYTWVTKEELEEKYSIPTAFSYFLTYFLKQK